jgi:hypothetical protein
LLEDIILMKNLDYLLFVDGYLFFLTKLYIDLIFYKLLLAHFFAFIVFFDLIGFFIYFFVSSNFIIWKQFTYLLLFAYHFRFKF